MEAAQRLTFPSLLKRYRDAAGLTQEELAERAGLSPRGLIYLERGARRPYPDTVRRPAAAPAPRSPERGAPPTAPRAGRAPPPPPLLFFRGHPPPAPPPP